MLLTDIVPNLPSELKNLFKGNLEKSIKLKRTNHLQFAVALRCLTRL